LIEVAAHFRIVASLGYLLANSSVKRNQESFLRSRQIAASLTEADDSREVGLYGMKVAQSVTSDAGCYF
jgi:hypothetical protein